MEPAGGQTPPIEARTTRIWKVGVAMGNMNTPANALIRAGVDRRQLNKQPPGRDQIREAPGWKLIAKGRETSRSRG